MQTCREMSSCKLNGRFEVDMNSTNGIAGVYKNKTFVQKTDK